MKKLLLGLTLAACASAPAVFAQTATPASPSEPVKAATSWADKTAFKGDVRFRYENIDSEGKDQRERERVRARLQAVAKPSTELEAGIGLSTTEANDPVSGNQTLTGSGSRKNAYFDLMYIDYHPEAVPGLRTVLGKQETPFIKVSDLVFDNDYNPEALAIKYKTGDSVQFLLNGAGVALEERAEDSDTMMYGAQAAIKLQNEQASYLQAGISYYQYENMKGYAPLFDPVKGAKGNSTDKVVGSDGKTNVLYANEFTIPELFIEGWMNSAIPVGFYANYAYNDDASSEETAYLIGFKVGKAKNPGDFDFDYNYREVQKNSVVGMLTDSDSFGGGTDGKGHRLSLGYQISKGLKGSVTYFMDKTGISKDETLDYNRLQVDLIAKF